VCLSCDEGCGVGCAEAVVDVDDGDVGGAGVEHAEEGGGSVEAGSVADGGGDGDDGGSDEAAYYAGERAFHACADDDGVGCGELVADGEDAVEAGDADVVEAGDAGVEELGGDGGFFGGGLVAGAGGEDGDVAPRFLRGGLFEGDGAGFGMVEGCGRGFEDGGCGGLVGAGGEDVGSGGGHAGEDFGGVGGRFVLRVDDFGEAGAEGAVVVDAGEAEVFVGKSGEADCGGLRGEGAGFDGGEEFEQGGFCHLALVAR